MTAFREFRPAAVFAAFWLIGIALMSWSYVANPVNPSLRGTERYGTTYAGELRFILMVTLLEITISLGVLRPWSYRRSWIRVLVLLLLLTPWLLLWGALGLHAGPTTHTHTLWLVFWIGLLGAAIVSGTSAVRARRRSAPHAA
jgi:hypothetical protein